MRDLQVLALVRILGLATLAHGQTLFWPLAIIANEGESAVFACSPFLGGSNPVLEIQRPGESTFTTVQTDDPRLSFQDFTNDPTNRTYTYSNVQRSEHGTMFTCNVNSIGAQEPGTLTVNFPPTYTDPGEQTVVEGQNITVSLTVVSRPTERTVGTLTRDGGATVSGDTTYDTVSVTFNDVQRSDAGVYILTSSNTAGEGSVNFTLNVLFPPTFTAGTGRLIRGVRPGGSITLSCAVEGDPTPDVTYTHPDPDPHNATFDSNVITIASAASDQGVVMYTCTANNSIASDVRLTYDLYTGETNTSLNLAIIIGASAGGGGLILLALFVIVCRACLVTRRKETKKQLQNKTTHNSYEIQCGTGDQDDTSVDHEYEEIPDQRYMPPNCSSTLPSVLATSRLSIQKSPETSSAAESYEELPDIFFKPTSAAGDDSDRYHVNEPTSATSDEHDEYYVNEPEFFKNNEKSSVTQEKRCAAAKPPAKGATHQYVNTPRRPQKPYQLPPHTFPHRAGVVPEEMLYDQAHT